MVTRLKKRFINGYVHLFYSEMEAKEIVMVFAGLILLLLSLTIDVKALI